MLIPSLLSLLAPHDCVGCQAEGALLCADCRTKLLPAVTRCYNCHRFDAGSRTCAVCRRDSALFAVHAAVRYENLARRLVWRLKFGRARAAALEIAAIMAEQLPVFTDEDIIVTFAPTATHRVRQRGYDQASLIAKEFARLRDLPFTPLLARQGKQKQVGASRRVRLQQLESTFRPIHAVRLSGATVILVDDVVTTGATLQAAAGALKAAGARRVIGAVFAQA